ncbi:MAG: YggT family protein [Coriobacteriales bacterium]|nr:YggT family protein [Coriobacteriales bacterium]MBQ6587018.1 YggT family protein [Coriobacteriales bacterium]
MIGRLFSALIDFYVILIVIYVLMSWFPHEKGIMKDIYDVLGSVCEPYLGLFRKIIPPMGNIDFSPVFAVIVLELIARLIVKVL